MKINKTAISITVTMVCTAILSIGGCKSGTTNTTATTTAVSPNPIGGALVNSDSIVKVKIETFEKQASGYAWTLTVLVESSTDVGTLPNPVKDSVGKVITVKTDEDLTLFKAGDVVNARIKYVGDVNTPGGIGLLIYDIAK